MYASIHSFMRLTGECTFALAGIQRTLCSTEFACGTPAAAECGRRCVQCIGAKDPDAKDADGNLCAEKCEECSPFMGCGERWERCECEIGMM